MAARKHDNDKYYRQNTALYVEGNTVHLGDETNGRGESRHAVSHKVRKNRERARHWNLPYVMILLTATVFTVGICYMYLNLQSSITAHKHNIASLQTQVTTIRTANDATQESLKVYTDLNTVYQVATEELGMVYPNEEQVIEYDKSESEYVRQYDQIPTEE